MSKFLTISKIYINRFFNWFLNQLSQDEIKKIKEKPINAIFNKALILVFFSFISLVFIFISCGRNSTYLTIEDLKNKDGNYNVEKLLQEGKKGSPLAQRLLGYCYSNGKGVNQDFLEALKWYQEAAEQGDMQAQYELGCYYLLGYGGKINIDEALKWYQKAAEQGHANSQFQLGNSYIIGWGVKQDYSEAIKWLKKAAEQGLAIAQFSLGELYYDGHGVKQDFKEAVKWYQKAAKQGDKQAQSILGFCYQKGIGIKQDFEEAFKWYQKAAEQGDEKAQYALDHWNKHIFSKNHIKETSTDFNNNFNLFKNAEFECKKIFEKNITAIFKTYFSSSEKSYKLEFSNGKEIWINYLNTERDGRAYFKASNGIKEIFGSISFTKGDLEINFEDSDYEKLNGSYSRTR